MRSQLVLPQPGQELLLDCSEPRLVPNPDTADDKALAQEKREVGDAWKCERARRLALVKWVEETLGMPQDKQPTSTNKQPQGQIPKTPSHPTF